VKVNRVINLELVQLKSQLFIPGLIKGKHLCIGSCQLYPIDVTGRAGKQAIPSYTCFSWNVTIS